MKFEYTTRMCSQFMTTDQMNDLGIARWELVSFQIYSGWYYYVFKRVIE